MRRPIPLTALTLTMAALMTTGCVKRNAPLSEPLSTVVCNPTGPTSPPPITQYVAPYSLPSSVAMDLGREPVVVYYAVDTRERLMQLAVDEDLRSLRAACEETTDPAARQRVNWIAFTNSHYLRPTGPTYLICEKGVFAEKPYPEAVRNTLQAANAQVTDPNTYLGVDPALVAIRIDGWRQHPFADRRFLAEALNLAAATFSPADHIFNIHLKSHGSTNLSLTGLDAAMVTNKNDCTDKVLAAIAEPGKTLREIEYGSAGVTRDANGNVPLSLGTDPVVLGPDDQPMLGHDDQPGLSNEDQIGLGTGDTNGLSADGAIALGDETGLGADNYYGTPAKFLLSTVAQFLNTPAKPVIGYMILEGCFSAGGPQFMQHATLLTATLFKRLHRVYAASGSLWYRNVSWKQVYADWLATNPPAKDATEFVRALDLLTPKIKNYKKAG